MPFTLLAHQAPILPLIERRGGRWDGVALVAGSVAPDLFEVTRGWGGPAGDRDLWFDGHSNANIPVVVATAVLLAVVLRRWVLPVAAAVLPDAGPFHLHDYRSVGDHRHRWWVVVVSALVGVLTHLALDGLTHADSSPLVAWGILDASGIEVAGRHLGITALLQVAVSAVLAAYALWALRRIGRNRLLRSPADRRVDATLPGWAKLAFWGWTAASIVLASAYAMTRTGYHVSSRGVLPLLGKPNVVSAFLCVAVIGVAIGCVALRPLLVAEPVVEATR